MKRKILLVPLSLVLVTGLLLGACAQPAPAPAAPKLTLPQGYIKASDVVPAMGEHWLNPENPTAPVYLIYEGEVIGIEYLWTEDILQEVPGPPGTTIKVLPSSLPVGVTVDHFDVAWMTPGVHEGPPVDHWEVHIYFITQAEKAAITP